MTKAMFHEHSEAIQARLAAYAGHEEDERSHYDLVIALLGQVAIHGGPAAPPHLDPDDLNVWRQASGWRGDAQGAQAGYLEFASNPPTPAEVAAQHDLITAFGRFEPLVMRLKADIDALPKPFQHPDYLGMGASFRAFRLATEDGEYVVRFPWGSEGHHVHAVERRARSGLRVRGQAGFSAGRGSFHMASSCYL